ncbi:methionyl-tRNA formyltransferase [Laribacter hongkongensis]|uniref:formyltransferase family protein n=1 Tax=Laribacter hongkongensis TaxID=168471 RepID=UPI001EFC4129|nr:formyltransferase family protein [Laribacter hongkongensis]MCG9021635.1 methionyl-tRNA formyltransferase [Laribacter hongkongensis]
MRVVIVGQKWLGIEVLKLCLARGDEIRAVLAPEGDRLHEAAQRAGITVSSCGSHISASDIPPDTDLILAAHAHAFIDAGARLVTRFGALGYHPSLLPRHRGREAIRWTLHMREPVAGGTVYWMDDGADTGPIAAQDWCHVRPADDVASLWRRELAPMGIRLIRQVLADLDRGRVVARPQEEAVATWEPAFTGKRLASGDKSGANHGN